jgi:hypothetical protein
MLHNNKRMQTGKISATGEVEQGHECFSWVVNSLLAIILGVCCVPFSASRYPVFSDYIGENSPSNLMGQR